METYLFCSCFSQSWWKYESIILSLIRLITKLTMFYTIWLIPMSLLFLHGEKLVITSPPSVINLSNTKISCTFSFLFFVFDICYFSLSIHGSIYSFIKLDSLFILLFFTSFYDIYYVWLFQVYVLVVLFYFINFLFMQMSLIISCLSRFQLFRWWHEIRIRQTPSLHGNQMMLVSINHEALEGVVLTLHQLTYQECYCER